jgi:hypothetical protein
LTISKSFRVSKRHVDFYFPYVFQMKSSLKKTVPYPTDRSYSSVADLLKGEKAGRRLQRATAKLASQRLSPPLKETGASKAKKIPSPGLPEPMPATTFPAWRN